MFEVVLRGVGLGTWDLSCLLTSGKQEQLKEAPSALLADSMQLAMATPLAYSLAWNLSRRLPQLSNKYCTPTNNRVDDGKFIGEYFATFISSYVRSCPDHTNVVWNCLLTVWVGCVVLRNRCLPTTFHTVVTVGGDADRWCVSQKWPAWSAPERQILTTYLLPATGLAQCG